MFLLATATNRITSTFLGNEYCVHIILWTATPVVTSKSLSLYESGSSHLSAILFRIVVFRRFSHHKSGDFKNNHDVLKSSYKTFFCNVTEWLSLTREMSWYLLHPNFEHETSLSGNTFERVGSGISHTTITELR